jgi:cbb3-type cytochrome oxidase maturation protein
MEVLFVALPIALLLGAAAVAAFIIAARHGQFDDLETPPQRMLYDDLEVAPAAPQKETAAASPPPERSADSPQTPGENGTPPSL